MILNPKVVKSFLSGKKGHILFWAIYITYAYLINQLKTPPRHFLDIFLSQLTIIVVFYSSSWYFGIRYKKSKWAESFFFVPFFYIFFCFLWYVYGYIIRPQINFPPPVIFEARHFLQTTIILFIQYTLLGAGLSFAIKSHQTKKHLVEQELQNSELKRTIAEAERRVYQTEANFLRAQINPHFLQNTLNFLYAQSVTGKTENISEGILLLSDMMRYSLQNQGDSNARVPLQHEVQHLRNYIAINQLRFNGRLQVKLQISGEGSQLTIIPLVLLTLLENAFKHGELHDADNPLCVQLTINDAAGSIHFEVINKIRTGPREQSTGIGIENTRRRLDTAYPGNFTLETGSYQEFYKAALKIRLK